MASFKSKSYNFLNLILSKTNETATVMSYFNAVVTHI